VCSSEYGGHLVRCLWVTDETILQSKCQYYASFSHVQSGNLEHLVYLLKHTPRSSTHTCPHTTSPVSLPFMLSCMETFHNTDSVPIRRTKPNSVTFNLGTIITG